MFSSFSWTNYLLFTAIVLVIYALIILGLYYRREMNKLFFSRSEALQEMIDRPVAALSDPMRMVHELVSELGQLIRDAAENETFRLNYFSPYEQLIKNYLILRPTEFKGRDQSIHQG
jgi:hypothetical protein